MEILKEPPLIGQDKGPIWKEKVSLEKVEEEKEEDKEREDAPKKSPELKHHIELKHPEGEVPQKEGVTKENIATIELDKERAINIEDSDEEERIDQEALGHEEK